MLWYCIPLFIGLLNGEGCWLILDCVLNDDVWFIVGWEPNGDGWFNEGCMLNDVRWTEDCILNGDCWITEVWLLKGDCELIEDCVLNGDIWYIEGCAPNEDWFIVVICCVSNGVDVLWVLLLAFDILLNGDVLKGDIDVPVYCDPNELTSVFWEFIEPSPVGWDDRSVAWFWNLPFSNTVLVPVCLGCKPAELFWWCWNGVV